MDRKARSEIHQRRSLFQRRARATQAVEFFNILTSPELIDTTEALLPEHRERLYPPTVTLSMFMRQTLEADGSCQKAVDGWAAQRAADGLHACSVRTGAYCKARQRLPLQMVSALARETGRLLSGKALPAWQWRGRAVKLVDGTSLSMPDTPANQAAYPQPRSQAPGVGYPLARMVAVVCLATGAVLDAGIGPHAGKGTGEMSLLRALLGTFEAGDVMLADALYCNYFLIAMLLERDVDVVFKQGGARITDFRRGLSLGTRDHLVHWRRPDRPAWMTPEQYARMPQQLCLREAQVGHQVLVTSMGHPGSVSKADLSRLYARRWNIELDLRNLKTTTGMDVLDCQTPAMNDKQLWVHLLAHNVIRLLMAAAAARAGVQPRSLSFKHALQLWNEWTSRGLSATLDDQRLLKLIAQCKVGQRPGRIEPRLRKRRPKPYGILKIPRGKARQHVRNHGHPTKVK